MTASTTPGWQPYDEGTERYWDGERWQGEPRQKQTDASVVLVNEIRQLRESVDKTRGLLAIWFIVSLIGGMAILFADGQLI